MFLLKQAQHMCKRYNGYLAQIGSREEMEALNEYFNQNAENHMFPYWIGTSSNYSSWLWCNGGNDNYKHSKEQENSRCTFLKVKTKELLSTTIIP